MSPIFWIMLGECQSKCEHLANVPLRPATARELHEVYLAKGAQATTAIEGNTLSEEQVRDAIHNNLRLPPSKNYLKNEVENILEAFNAIRDEVLEQPAGKISVEELLNYNRQVLRNLELAPEVDPGQLRHHSVVVGRYRAAPSGDLSYLMDRFVRWINSEQFEPDDPSRKIAFGLIRAILAHLYIAWIHPFGDGNGRTARLVEFKILLASGMPTPATHLLSNHYNQTRTQYYLELDKASRSGGNLESFLHYAIQGFLDGIRQQIDTVWEQQWDVAWRNFVHERFRDKKTATSIRRRNLLLSLTGQWEAVDQLLDASAQRAKSYANKTDKTLSRDINHLIEMELIEKKDRRIRARKELILAFRPLAPDSTREEA